MALVARWRCESCGTSHVERVPTAERGYFCCFASMTYLGVEPARDSDRSGEAGETRSGSTEGESAVPKAIAQAPDSPDISEGYNP